MTPFEECKIAVKELRRKEKTLSYMRLRQQMDYI